MASRLFAITHNSLRLLAGCAMLGGLLACGYKGPLYLPPPEDPPADLTAPPTAAPDPESTSTGANPPPGSGEPNARPVTQ